MNDQEKLDPPKEVPQIEVETKKMGFEMASEHQTGCLLRTLASTKPSGRFLELGTGTGLSAAWILGGMDDSSRLLSVDNDENVVSIAKRNLGHDPRVSFFAEDGSAFLERLSGETFDLIFADTWPGKIWDLDVALNLLADGGIYIVDDMCHRPHWPEGHLPKIQKLIQTLEERNDLLNTKLDWSTGIMIITKRPNRVPVTDS